MSTPQKSSINMIDFSDQAWIREQEFYRRARKRDLVLVTLAEFTGCLLAFVWWLLVT